MIDPPARALRCIHCPSHASIVWGPRIKVSLVLCLGPVYAYMEDLHRLDMAGQPRPRLPTGLTGATPSPLRAAVWQEALQHHPDQRFCHFLIRGLQEGLRVGYHGRQSQLRSSRRNIPSAYEHPEVVDAYLAHECQLGRVLGPITGPPVPLHTSRSGVIPKKSNPGTWRLIVDLSSPEGASVNDGIAPELCSLRFCSLLIWPSSRYYEWAGGHSYQN